MDFFKILPKGAVTGEVLEKGTRAPVEGASVYLVDPSGALKAEASTDGAGGFSIRGVAPGTYELKVLAPGFLALSTQEKLPEEGTLSLSLRLSPSIESSYGLVVRGEQGEEEVTRRVLSTDEMEKMPGTQGDVLRGLQNLPGVARIPFGGALLVVRGSAPQDTQTFVDGMPVPVLFHLEGLSSVIASDLLTQLEFLPGVFSARYGRGMGGIIDAETHAGKDAVLRGSAKTDVLDSGFYLQGPLGGSGASFAVAARRSYIDTLMPVFVPEESEQFTVAPRYWDYQAAAGAPLFGGEAQLFIFGSSDRLELSIDDPALGSQFISSEARFHRLQGVWRQKIAPGLTRRVAASVGVTEIGYTALPDYESHLRSFLGAARVDWADQLSRSVALAYGVDLKVDSLERYRRLPGGFGILSESNLVGTYPYAALYTEAQLRPKDNILFVPGLRADYFGSSEEVTLDPRFSWRWDIDLKTAIKGGAGLYHQAPRPHDLDPTFGDPELFSKLSAQATLGLERKFLGDRLDLDAAVFYKKLARLITEVGSGETPADLISNDGRGRVYGLEVLLRYPPGPRFFGWVAYSLSRAERKNPDEENFVPFSYDQTHVLTALGSYKLKNDMTLGARFRYATGNPQTPVLGAIFDSDRGDYLPLPGERFADRLPAFHELDLRVDKLFRFNDWMFSAYLEVMNVYNRRNPESLLYNFDYTKTQFLSGLPILPVFGVKSEF